MMPDSESDSDSESDAGPAGARDSGVRSPVQFGRQTQTAKVRVKKIKST
jgi:hypothetical protein